MCWDGQVASVVAKANKSMGMLRRNLKIASINTKETAYKALVRPSLEFASSAWDPYLKKHKKKLEAVQRRAARWTVNRHRQTSSVGQMLDQLQWPTLEERRRKARLVIMYKYHNGLLHIDTNKPPTRNPDARNTRRTHAAAYHTYSHSTDYRKFAFFPRTLCDWNLLPSTSALAATVGEFKSRI